MHLPEAQLISVASTAAAAEAVSKQSDSTADCAAICSKICLQLFGNLELLHEGIQNEHREPRPLRVSEEVLNLSENFTRFYILANHPSSPLPNTPHGGREELNALIRLELQQGRAEIDTTSHELPHPTITDLLAALRLPAIRIDRRPSVQRELFGSVYIVEAIDDEASQPSQLVCEEDHVTGLSSPWMDKVFDAIARVVARGGRADLLGIW